MVFGANKTPVEVIKEDAFRGTYFRDNYSNVKDKWYKKSWKEFNQLKKMIKSITDGRWKLPSGNRWKKIVSRFRGKLVKVIKNANSKFDDYSISLKIRQTLSHWGYEFTEKT